MKPFPKFPSEDQSFWANVKLISETIGYSDKSKERLKRYSIGEFVSAFKSRGVAYDHIYDEKNMIPTTLGKELQSYLNQRSIIIETFILPNLMDRAEAKEEFDQ